MEELEVPAPFTILLSANAIGFGILSATVLNTCKTYSILTGLILSTACCLCIYFLMKLNDTDLSKSKDVYNGVVVAAFLVALQGDLFLPLFIIRILEAIVTLFSSALLVIEVEALREQKSSDFEPRELYWSTLSMNTMALLGVICMTLFVDRL